MTRNTNYSKDSLNNCTYSRQNKCTIEGNKSTTTLYLPVRTYALSVALRRTGVTRRVRREAAGSRLPQQLAQLGGGDYRELVRTLLESGRVM